MFLHVVETYTILVLVSFFGLDLGFWDKIE